MISLSNNLPIEISGNSFSPLNDHLPGALYRMELVPFRRISYLSKGIKSISGYDANELTSTDLTPIFLSIVHPDDLKLLEEKITSASPGKSVQSIKYRIVDKKGRVRWIRDTYSYVWSANSGLLAIEGFLASEIRNFDYRVLLNRFKAYRSAVNASIITSITNTRGVITHVNRNFCKASKYSRQELVGKSHNIINSGYHSRAFFAEMWQTILSGKTWYGEILNKAKDGSLYWVDTVIIPVFDADDKIECFLSLRILINGRKDAENDFAQYAHALEEISFMVSHNLRGPLCSMLGLMHLLEKENVNDNQVVLYQHFKNSLEKLEHITKELSSFVYSNEIELKYNRFDNPYTRHPLMTIAYVYKENSYLE